MCYSGTSESGVWGASSPILIAMASETRPERWRSVKVRVRVGVRKRLETEKIGMEVWSSAASSSRGLSRAWPYCQWRLLSTKPID